MRILPILILVLAISLFPIGADAGIKCSETTHALSRLKTVFQEREVAVSETASGVRLSVFASEKNQTWTVIGTFPDRAMTCLLASGDEGDPIPDIAEILEGF